MPSKDLNDAKELLHGLQYLARYLRGEDWNRAVEKVDDMNADLAAAALNHPTLARRAYGKLAA